MTQRELDARVASIQYTETTDLNLPAIEVAGDAFEAGVEWADGHPNWISVEDELPRCYIPYNNWDGTPSDVLESEKVIALLSDGTICIATFNQNLDVDTDKPTGSPYWFDEGHPEDGDRIRGEVTHWMSLPQRHAVLSSLEIAGKNWKEKKGGEE